MNIESLKVFKDLVDTQSFTKAGDKNYITQSAVSQQIKKLEMIFKTKLFIKKDEKLELTKVGKILYKGAQKIIEEYEKMMTEINSEFDENLKKEIKITSIYSFGIYLLNVYIKDFLLKHPSTKLNIFYDEWDDVIRKVIDGDCDFGFVSCKKLKDMNITSMHIYDEEMVFVAPPNFKIDGDMINLKDALSVRLILFEKNTPSRRFVEDIVKEKGIKLNVTMDLNNIETIKAAVSSNVGCSILPYSTVENESKGGKLRVLRFTTPFSRPIYLIYNRRRKFQPPHSWFLDFFSKT